MWNKTNLKTLLLMPLFFVLMTCSITVGRTIYVDDDGPSDFSNIQSAIDAAFHGDTIVVADGLYTGEGNYDIDLRSKNIILRSENGPEGCVIDCEGRRSHCGFYLHRTAHPESVINGFTIRNGNAGAGAGIYLYYCGPTIKNCIISNNHAESSGGGIYCAYGSPKIINCIISNNSASYAGGIFVGVLSSPKITNCTIVGNSALQWGGGISIADLAGRQAFISNCILHANTCHAIYEIVSHSDPTVENCFFGYNPDGDYYDDDTDSTLNGAEQINTLTQANNNTGGSDPMFGFEDDYHLTPDSPCIDTGTNDPCGILLAVDLDGNARPLDGDGDTNPVADIGAYEFRPNLPTIGLTPCALFFRRALNKPDPPAQTLYIRNTSEGLLNWEVKWDCPWLEVVPETGYSNGEVDQVELRIDSTGLLAGGHRCFLEISDSSVSNSTRMVLVRLHVDGTLNVPQKYAKIQDAIDDAMDGDTVLVSDGIYKGDGNRNIQFWDKPITLKSEHGPSHCIIDCGWIGSAMAFYDYENVSYVVDGFTILSAKGVINCYGSSAAIKNCVFTNNKDGAVIYARGSNLSIVNCTIIDNEDVVALKCTESHVDIKNCTIFKNYNGGKYTGAIYCDRGGTVSIANVILWENYPCSIYIESGLATANYSCIQGGWPGVGNIDINPLLTGNGHLQADSPCIDLSSTGPSHDMDGEERPVGIVFDIGSDEFLDSDNDGLPNWWELKYFGSIIDSDPNDDTDDDDKKNLEEYILSNNPLGPYYVDGVKGDDLWDGCAPICDGLHGPKSTIQAAINAAHNGDTIVIADGIYTGSGNMDIDFHGKAVTLTSNNGSQNCIIDCQASEGNKHRGFYFHTNEGPNSIMNGFTITNGVASEGGGIYCEGSSPTIQRCNIIGNYSQGRDGGGIFCDYSSPRIIDSIIRENKADGDGGGIYCEDSSNAVVSNSVICDNKAGRDGGGVVSWYSSKVLLRDCKIAGNHAGRDGGGLEAFHDSPVLLNCLIVDNSADSWGGGLCVNDGTNFKISNCTITNNFAANGGGLYVKHFTLAQLKNSILYRNFPNEMSLVYYSNVIAEYTDIEGGWLGEGNIDCDPCFVRLGYWVDVNDPNISIEPSDPNAMWIEGDYHLLQTSACINVADNNSLPTDTHDLDGDGNTTEPIPFDIEGNPRIVYDIVDMGAFEFVNTPPIADTGPDQVIECACNTEEGTKVTLDGTKSSDPDYGVLTYTWTGPFIESPAHGATPTVTLEGGCPGEYVITLVVNDGIEDSEPNEVIITVLDTTPPDFELSISPAMLWPPDHKMVEITPSWMVSDECDATPDVSLVGIVANEGDNAVGDGHTTNDIQIGEDGSIFVRSERSGTGSDRVYTITYQAVDDCGNVTVRSATVSIPHDFQVLARIASRWLWTNHVGRIPEDLNGDGIVNLADFARFANNWIK